MTLPLHDIIFRSRALAQSHPFTARAQAYLNQIIAQERANQPAPDMSFWASQAITVGYCLRKIEEDDSGKTMAAAGSTAGAAGSTAGAADAHETLDQFTDDLVETIQNDTASEFYLYPEALIVDALDHIIGGEIERRLADIAEKVDKQTFEELESYIGWWTLKGYCLRVAEQLVGAA